MHSRNHNNAIRAWKDEEPAWHCVFGEIICVSTYVCVFGEGGVTRPEPPFNASVA